MDALKIFTVSCVMLTLVGVAGCTPRTSVENTRTKPLAQHPSVASTTRKPQESPKTPRRLPQRAGYRKLRALRVIDLAAATYLTKNTSGLSRVAVSPDGRWIAVVGWTPDASIQWLHVYRTSDGKRVFRFKPADYGLEFPAWHPTEPIVAFQGTTGEPSPLSTSVYCGFGMASVSTRKTRFIRMDDLAEREPFDWLPDGVSLFSDNVVVNTKTGKHTLAFGRQFPNPGRKISISKDWQLAAEIGMGVTYPPRIDLLKIEPSVPYQLEPVAELKAQRDPKTKAVESYRTQPAFLNSGRLAFVKVFLKPNGERERVEVWTVKADGTDEKPWLKLPVLGDGPDGSFSVAPVSWSRDGRIVAYADGAKVRIFRTAEAPR